MSSSLPPSGPPLGPPPSGPPEFLSSGSGSAMPPSSRPAGRGRRRVLVGGGAVLGLAALGTGGWFAWSAYFATGPQPAEALPADTIGYVSVDLDPSGKQKLEALDTLEKFPAFTDNVDLDRDDDLRRRLFETAQDDGACPDIDWADDIEPWLGDRFAMAAVDLGGDQGVTPVAVVQVDDAAAAEDGLAAIRDCAAGSGMPDEETGEEGGEETGGWSIEGDWAVVAETTELAEQVTDATADGSLAADDDFEKWTEAAGDEAILTAYAAPEAGRYLADALGSYGSAISPQFTTTCEGIDEESGAICSEDSYDDEPDPLPVPPEEATAGLRDFYESFDGAALKVRFDDGGLEVESASSADGMGLSILSGTDRGDDVVATLPESTGLAVGLGFEEGWVEELITSLDEAGGGMFDLDEALAELEAQTGLSLPEDLETLAGDSMALSLDGSVDPSALEVPDPSGIPAGIKVQGDPDAIEDVLDRLLASAGAPPELKDELGYSSSDEHVAAGFSADYTEQLLDDGGLGETDAYRDVVERSDDASAVLFANFDAGDWLVRLAGDDEEVRANLEPLDAAGLSAWTDDDVAHGVLRITTD